jgi:hypothetical protein
MKLTSTPQWRNLVEHQKKLASVHMRDLFAQDPDRFKKVRSVLLVHSFWY